MIVKSLTINVLKGLNLIEEKLISASNDLSVSEVVKPLIMRVWTAGS